MSAPMPVPWHPFPIERDGITGTLENVPKRKIISGIPFYTRLWKTNASGEVSSEAIGMDKADQILSDYKVTAGWSSETSQDYAEFTDEDGNFCQIWLENESIDRREDETCAGIWPGRSGRVEAWI